MAKAVEKPAEPAKEDEKKEADKKEEEPEELSEEDQKLKDTLDGLVGQLGDQNATSLGAVIAEMGKEIKEATTSMTSVPKPLKFLRPHYATVKAAFDTVPSACQQALADVISVLATVSADEGERDALHFRLKGTDEDPGAWGHEYMRHLAGEIAAEHSQRTSQEPPQDVADLMKLVMTIVPHHMQHNTEPEAVDLLLEVDAIDSLLPHIDEGNYTRTCLYLTSTAAYLSEPDDAAVLHTAYDAYIKVTKWHDAMRVALRLNDGARIEKVFTTCPGALDKQQLAHLLARQGVMLDLEEGPCAIDDEDTRAAVTDALSNTKLSERYLAVARDLDVMAPKHPDDVYKMHLVDTTRGGLPTASMDSAMKNLSTSVVNALLNLGFGTDKLVTVPRAEGEKTWIQRNKDQGKICAVASIGAISMWDVDGGLAQVDPYTYSEQDTAVRAGACLGIGLSCCCVRSEIDPAYALLCEHVHSDAASIRAAAVMGLGLAYAGTRKAEVQELLLPLVDADESDKLELVAHACLALGFTYAGSADGEIAEAVLHFLMLTPEAKLSEPWIKFVILGLGFLFLGRQEAVEATVEVAKTLSERVARLAAVTLETCAYAGSGNVLKVQEMLALCGEHIDAEEGHEWQTAHLTAATVGVALVAMGEDLGTLMATRMLEHLLSYAAPEVRAAVPLALALLRPSQPDMNTMDALSRLSHDADNAVSRAAILGLGVLGAGTNNARLAGMLRNLSSYCQKDPPSLHLVRLAQGLLHLGKGLVTINPYHSDRQLLSPLSLAALLTLLWCGSETSTTLCGSHAFMAFHLAPAMRPRMLMTVDEAGDVVPVSVRVGTAVDTVAQAGKPKSITGFQTHDTPVLLATDDRAELASERYEALSPLLEGVVIVRKNPAYVEGTD